MTLARTLFGLATLAGSAAPAAAQLSVMPAPRDPTRIIYPAPPWVINGLRPGVASTVYAAPPAAVPADVNAVRPNWTGPQPPTGAAPAVAPAPESAPAPRPAPVSVAPAVVIPTLPAAPSTPPVPSASPAVVPLVPTAAPVAPVTPVGGTAPRLNPGIVDRPATPGRPLYRPSSTPATTPRPDVWGPGTPIPATLPRPTAPAAPRR